MKCSICDEEIKIGEVCYSINCGEFNEDEFGGIGFEEAQSMAIHGYAHPDCITGKQETIRKVLRIFKKVKINKEEKLYSVKDNLWRSDADYLMDWLRKSVEALK